ncbi:putative RING-H2 finger protein ATL2C [Hordeum vulgare]|uniref:RING-type E3 ubiquitin transferase n=1 Tax=Hordeum vulgare subsp. vulgare TaxID=112509 RepID=F2EEJ8_HORVV|nr:putative RING-H2 finger protein ATL2C [Hordeum vulgare]BAK05770.1 predicted protein [Hordeum vulgare subsp. vulgare]
MDTSSLSTPAAPPPPPTHSVLDTIQNKLSPGVLLIVAILAMVFFIFGLLNLLVQNILRLRRARRHRLRVAAGDVDGSSPTALQGQLQQLFHLHDAGVDQAFIDALPVFVYRAILGAGAGHRKGGGDPFDCAVCLCEFAMDDALRLLPTCGHAFHVPCIDAWLLSHSTCPLCRGSVLAADLSPASSPVVLVLESEGRASETPGGWDENENEASPKAEEVVEVKLGKLRCMDGNGGSGHLAADQTASRGELGRRRCLSMGSYEYVMDDHAALRVAIKTPAKKPPRSRRRHALSECDFRSDVAKKGAWEAAVQEAAAPAIAVARRGDDARLSNKDSFSVSKIWMARGAKKEDGRILAGGRRSVSFRWPAMAEASRNEGADDRECRDVESQSASFGSSGAPSLAEERLPLARTRTAPLWAAGGWQPSSSAGSHS